MNRLFVAHTHYIPPSLFEDQLCDIGAIVVPEFYPNLVNTYYGKIDYFKSIPSFISFFATLNVPAKPLYFAIENIRSIRSVDEVVELKQMGVCSLQLFHHQSNSYFSNENGLTSAGYELLNVMEAEEIALDLSHLNDHWINKLTTIFHGKIVVSHCAISDFLENPNSRTGCISVETVKRLIDMDALIGMSFVNDTIARYADEQYDENVYLNIIDQISFLLDRFGKFNLCLGPDYFDSDYFSKVYDRRIFVPKCFYDISGYKRLYRDLIERHRDEQVVNGVFWSNAVKWYSEQC